jgi:Rho termination factor-like protein
MQAALNVVFQVVYFVAIAYLFIGFALTLFPDTLPPVPSTQSPISIPQSPVPSPQYATLDWVKAVADEPTESVSVISLAIPRMKVFELKAIARSRGIKNYGKMNKSQLIQVMS